LLLGALLLAGGFFFLNSQPPAPIEAHTPPPALPVIPGGVGFGMGTPAGSGPDRAGGAILHVTSWADSGPGSLREALMTPGPRIVVFDISGYISLRSEIHVTDPYLTIAGQTAPSPGITLKGAGLIISTHDVLIQHIRIRVGDDIAGPDPKSRDGLQVLNIDNENDTYNVVIDHVSISWAIDENISTYYEGVHDVSVNHCIIGEGLWHSLHPMGPHSKGFLVGQGTHRLAVIGNLLIHNDERNIKANADTSTLFVNNLIVNWDPLKLKYSRSVYKGVGPGLKATIVGNVYRAHPADRANQFSLQNAPRDSQIYMNDNEARVKTENGWEKKSLKIKDGKTELSKNTPVWIASFKARSAKETPAWVLKNAGARPADRDAVDLRLLADAENGGGGLLDSPKDVGGWPPLEKHIRGTGGVPSLEIPLGGIQPSGYTQTEEWLHEMARQVENPA